MNRLSEMLNIGKNLEKRLQAVGINDAETLIHLGSKEAFTRLRLLEGDTCLSFLFAMEGALRGIRWNQLNSELKSELKEFFETFH